VACCHRLLAGTPLINLECVAVTAVIMTVTTIIMTGSVLF